MKKYLLFALIIATGLVTWSCGGDDPTPDPEPPIVNPPDPEEPKPNPNEVIYDETGCLYTSYDKLTMCGYQGWFATANDPLRSGWIHYPYNGQFKPEYSCIDFWPDMTEYEKQYAAPGFYHTDKSQAHVFSSIDEETIDLHFKWMKEYGIDGIFLQRFVSQTVGGAGKTRVNTVLKHALKAAKKYERAIAIMYDGSVGSEQDFTRISSDWNELVEEFKLFDAKENPTFLRHKGKPVFSIWGYGFNHRSFSSEWFDKLCEEVKGSEKKKVTILLGVPYSWRTFGSDCVDNDSFHDDLKKWCDVILPWPVGRYNNSNKDYISRIITTVADDIKWCKDNKIDYVPAAFPGFSWANMHGVTSKDHPYDQVPREKGDFLWNQIVAAKKGGANKMYIAMFDEMDEGTCIFKCATNSNVPLNGRGKFVGYDDEIGSDHYLWLTGEIAKLYKGGGGYGESQPIRK